MTTHWLLRLFCLSSGPRKLVEERNSQYSVSRISFCKQRKAKKISSNISRKICFSLPSGKLAEWRRGWEYAAPIDVVSNLLDVE